MNGAEGAARAGASVWLAVEAAATAEAATTAGGNSGKDAGGVEPPTAWPAANEIGKWGHGGILTEAVVVAVPAGKEEPV